MKSICIQRGLNPIHHQDAMRLYLSESTPHFADAGVDIKTINTAIVRSINWDYALYAFIDDTLAGIAGFQIHRESFTSALSPADAIQMLGLKTLIKLARNPRLKKLRAPAHSMQHNGLIVASEHARKEIGTTLLNELAKLAEKQGFKSLSLQVQKDNTAAKALYEKLGYRSVKHSKISGELMLQTL